MIWGTAATEVVGSPPSSDLSTTSVQPTGSIRNDLAITGRALCPAETELPIAGQNIDAIRFKSDDAMVGTSHSIC